MKKRILSIIMVLSMCLSMLPPAAFAAEDTGLCEHHPEHTEECGYAEAVAGVDCTHEHTADCYTNGVLPENDADSGDAYALEGDTEQTNTLLCTRTHDEGCYVTACVHAHDGECGYTEAVPCGHEHDAECGYVEAVEEVTCDCTETDESGEIAHAEDCGYVAPVEGTPCGHTEHTDCGYVEGAPCIHVCTEDTGCVTLSCAHVHDETCSSAGELDCQHVHDDTCGYVEAVEASPCTYECALCGLTEITTWSWIDQWEMLDPDTGVLALPGASADNPALFDDIVSLLPVEINATVEGGEETVTLDGWACPGYPEEGAYSGNYIFTAALPEGYTLAEDAPELTVTVELGGAAVYADVAHNGLTISGGTEGTDFAFNQEVLCEEGAMSSDNSAKRQGIKILTSTKLTISGSLAGGGDYTGIYIPEGVTANLTLGGATIGGGNNTCPITVEGTLNLTLSGENHVVPYVITNNGVQTSSAGIWVLENGALIIDGEGSLEITSNHGNAAIGQTGFATGNNFGVTGNKYSGANKAGSITINGGTLNITAKGEAGGSTSPVPGGAAIGGAGSGGFTNITINGGVINATSANGAAIGTGMENFSSTGKITINGGTIGTTGGVYNWGGTNVTGDGVGSTKKLTGDGSGVFINGGSVKNAVVNNRPTDGTNALYLATVTLDGVNGSTAVSAVTYYVDGEAKSYSTNGMQTDASGKLYLWMPEGAVLNSITASGATYYGSLRIAAADTNTDTFKPITPLTVTVQPGDPAATVKCWFDESNAPAGETLYVTITPPLQHTVSSITLSSGTVTKVEGDLYSFTMPESNTTLTVTTTQVNVPPEIDLAFGPVEFGYNETDKYYVKYYAAADASVATTATGIPADYPYAVKQSDSGTKTTANTITVNNWNNGGSDPLQLTINSLNINADEDTQTSTIEIKSLTKNLIDINGSTVELTLAGDSTLASDVTEYTMRNVALLGVDGSSELTITQASGSNKLTATVAAGRGAIIGGDGDTKGNPSACGTISIEGGKIKAKIGDKGYGAAIGSGQYGTGGIVNISGGEVEAISGVTNLESQGAAIGGGYSAVDCKVTISDGTVTATSTGWGAAIGSGCSESSFTANAEVTISGGTVTATSYGYGAAIGSGSDDTSNTKVIISNGTVIANSNGYGAAIGSGVRGNAAVTIEGGSLTANMTATENVKAAAIGSGYDANADITISGGDIIATNNYKFMPVIGSGASSAAKITTTITINGGNINIDQETAATIGKDTSTYTTATVTITGGSVNCTKLNVDSITNGTAKVYQITADLSDTVGDSAAVADASITGVTYGFNDVKTNQNGVVYLWLPNESDTDGTTAATFGGKSYTGEVETDNSGVFTVNKLTPTVTAPTANSRTYDGTEQALVTAGSTTGGTLQYALGTDSTTAPTNGWGTAIPTGTDAKTYYVWYRVVGNDEYADVAATCVTVTIAQIAITVKLGETAATAGSEANAWTATYNGSLATVEFTAANGDAVDDKDYELLWFDNDNSNTDLNDEYTALGSAPGNAGSYTFKFSGINNYYGVNYIGTLVIGQATPVITWGDASYTKEYTGNAAAISATIEMNSSDDATGTITYSYIGTVDGQTVSGTGLPTNAGSYTVTASYAGDNDHKAASAEISLTITPISITGATVTLQSNSAEYSGAEQPPVSSVELNGNTLAADNYTVSYLRNGTATTDFTNAGTITVVVEGKGNYTGKVEKSYTISPIAPIVANFDFSAPSNLTYSGTAKAAAVAPATGITGMGAVTVKYSADSINVGEYTVSIDVAAGTNYTAATDLTDSAWKFSITKAPLTITADNKSMLTGKTLPELTCSYSGFVNGETESVLTTQPSVTTTANGQTAGTFDITVSGATAANYDISYVKGTLTVSDHVHAWTYTADDTANTITAQCGAEGCPTPTQVITLAAPTGDLTYTGSAKEATVSGSIDGVATPTISYTGSLTEGKPVNAGSYTASITVEGKSVSVDIVIGNASQTAPSVSAKNETIKGAADGGITGATADMEYSTTSGGTYAPIPEKLAAGTYYVRYKAKANYDPSPDTTVTIAAGPAITVTFNVDGGTPAPDAQSLSYKEKVTRPPNPAKTDYEFLGWYNGDTAYDFNTEVTDASLTLTAKWKQVAFTVGVDIMDGNTGMEGIPVKLMKGSEVLHSGTTNSSGHIDFSHITAGAYNIVAVFGSGDTEQTRTALVTLTGDKTETINKPLEGANSHLTVTDDADTPAVVVGGLDTEAETLKTGDVDKVSVSMAVDGQKESEVQETVVESIKAQIQTDTNLKDASLESGASFFRKEVPC